MTTFKYIEIPFDQKTDLIKTLNEQGFKGYRFHSMAQKIVPGHDFRTGQPKVQMVLLMEQAIFQIDEK